MLFLHQIVSLGGAKYKVAIYFCYLLPVRQIIRKLFSIDYQ